MKSLADINEKRAAALSSVIAAIFLTGLKLTVGLKTNSLGILSEAAHSGLDLIAAGITYYAVSVSHKPPDQDHRYGHGKIENMSALVETVLLILTCAWILYEAGRRLITHEAHIEVSVYSYAVMIFAIVVDIGRSRVLSRAAKKYHSQALEADALHFSSDIWTSAVVVLGLFFVSQGYPALDAVAAILVALLVLLVSYRLGRRTIDVLVDKVPRELYQRVHGMIRGVEGVEEVQNVRLRSVGAKLFVDASVAIRRTATFARAHAVLDAIEDRVRSLQPDIDVVVHASPVETRNETIADKVRMVCVAKGLPAPHNLEIHRTGEKYYIDFDIEFPDGTTFQEAHDATVDIENGIRECVASIGGITVHIEESQSQEQELLEITEREQILIKSIKETVVSNVDVVNCDSVILLRWGGSYNASVTCGIEKSRSIGDVHRIVTQVETDLYRHFGAFLHRVTIHAEPR